MNPLIRFALGLADVPDKDVADLEKSLPALARLCKAARELKPILVKAQPLIERAKPLFEQALPIIEEAAPLLEEAWLIGEAAYPDMLAVAPTIDEFIAFINAKKA